MEFDIFYYENDISTIKNKKNPRIILSNPSVLRVLSDIINQTQIVLISINTQIMKSQTVY